MSSAEEIVRAVKNFDAGVNCLLEHLDARLAGVCAASTAA
jgi:hypothetical protein